MDRLWHEHTDWREDLGEALLLCFRVLAETGYHEEYGEFHVLWLPPGCEEPVCIKLNSGASNWMTVAVVVEDRLGRCRRYRERSQRLPFMTPSVLQTAICVNEQLAPTDKLILKTSQEPGQGLCPSNSNDS